jgi:hypothetical protein
MFKSIVFHERRPDFTRAQFMDHWLNVHAPMSDGVDDLYGYVCGEVLREIEIGELPAFEFSATIDGVAQMWFEQPDGIVNLPRQPKVKEWFSDGPNFIGRRTRFMAEEKLIVPPLRTTGVDPKLVILLTCWPEADKAAFRKHIEQVCSLMDETRFAGLGLTVSNIVSSPISASVPTFPMAPIDSAVEVWLQDKEDAEAASRAVIRKLIEAHPKLEIAGARTFLTEDTVIRRPLH